MYATNASGSWTLESVDSIGDVGKYSCIAVDSQNVVHISYYDATNGNLKYVKKKTNAWSHETIDSSGDVGKYTSMAVDSQGNIYISYYDSTNGNLKYAQKIAPQRLYVSINDPTCDNNTPCYTSIQEAINDVENVAILLIAGGIYPEPITLNDHKSIILQGGWNSSFQNQTDTTTFRDAPKAQKGSLTLQELEIKPQ